MKEQSVSIGVCCSRRDQLLPIITTILEQDFLPDEMIIVTTFELSQNEKRMISYVKRFYHKAILKISFYMCEYGNVSKSRNIIINKAKTDILIFIDDDITICDRSFLKRILLSLAGRSVTAVTPMVFPQKCNIFQLFLFLLYHYNLLTNSYRINDRYRLVKEYPISVVALDVFFIKSKKINFNLDLISGEDIDFTRMITQEHGTILVDRELFVTHKYVGSLLQFIRKIHWYVSGIIISDTITDTNRYGFIPTRKMQLVLFPLFYFERILSNSLILSKKIAPTRINKVLYPSIIFYSILSMKIYANYFRYSLKRNN